MLNKMNNSQKLVNLSSNLLMFLSFLYMSKTLIGINLVKNCHAVEVLLGDCNFSDIITITEKMYENYQYNYPHIDELSPEIEILFNNNVLQLRDNKTANTRGFTTSLFGNPGKIFSDIKVFVLLDTRGYSNDQLAVLARGNFTTPNSYNTAIDFSNRRLILGKTVGRMNTVPADEFNTLSILDQAYFVELEVIDNKLTANFFDASENTLLFTLIVTDTNNPLLNPNP